MSFLQRSNLLLWTIATWLLFCSLSFAQDIPLKVSDPPEKVYSFANLPADGKPHRIGVPPGDVVGCVMVAFPFVTDVSKAKISWKGLYVTKMTEERETTETTEGKVAIRIIGVKNELKDGTETSFVLFYLTITPQNEPVSVGSVVLKISSATVLSQKIKESVRVAKEWDKTAIDEDLYPRKTTVGKVEDFQSSKSLSIFLLQNSSTESPEVVFLSTNGNVMVNTTHLEGVSLLARQIEQVQAWVENRKVKT